MRSERPGGAWIGLTAAIVMIAAMGSGQSPTGGKAYSSPLIIPGSAFVSDGVDPDGATFENGAIVGTGVKVDMVAPVYLPDGATVGSFRAYIYDNDDVCGTNGEDVELFLLATSTVTGDAFTIAIATSSGASGTTQFVPTHSLNSTYATINNSSNQYWIEMRICSESHRLNAVVIEY